ncbi:glycoside hydrolase family 88 protein [Cellulomonas sp. NPDC089187]|uniref:glycoside hydrolase family 88 protein n=1 Tax=Cellulomonas sp. NPDC089187 TaxID=3154970 RepID=UPI00342E005C
MTTSTDDRRTLLTAATTAAVDRVRANVDRFGMLYPDDTTADDRYPLRPAAPGFAEGANRGWTTGFWPGMQWLAVQTGARDLIDPAQRHAADFRRRVVAREELDHHDLGFLYTLSCVADWRATGDEQSRDTAVEAARLLLGRVLEPAGIVQAWGDLTDPAHRGRTIIDSLMNMPLLTWAGEITGDPVFADIVRRHTEQLRRHIVRADGSTFHAFVWDPETGEPVGGNTEQGAGDGSCWSRGQAWGIYGFALNHEATGDPGLLTAAETCADYFLAHLPADRVPYWDLVYTDGSDAPRDSSASAIAVCGLHELARLGSTPERRETYRVAAEDLLVRLVETCTPAPDASDALLLHSVYDAPRGIGVDEGSLWGDYFYLEALVRHTVSDWQRPW